MSNFTREISNLGMLKNILNTNGFLRKVNNELIQNGRAFLAFRNDEATIYYNGNQLCNLSASNGYAPTIYNHYLPITRSRTLAGLQQKEAYSAEKWRGHIGQAGLSFEDVIYEILDNLKKEESPESLQASRFYRFSPLNQSESHEIVLLDIEAAFSYTGEKTDRIDLVFYHTVERRLMFVEVKRLSDSRLYEKTDAHGKIIKQAEVIDQLSRYQKRLGDEVQNTNEQYNNVINYYNAFSGKNLPFIIQDSKPLLGLLLVEFSRSDLKVKGEVQDLVKKNKLKMYAIGNTSNLTDSTLTAIYKSLK